MNEMVERVARAIVAEFARDSGAQLFVGDATDLTSVMIDGQADILAVARAAIAAMREPTDAMLNAPLGWVSPIGVHTRRCDYQAMIDAALNGERT